MTKLSKETLIILIKKLGEKNNHMELKIGNTNFKYEKIIFSQNDMKFTYVIIPNYNLTKRIGFVHPKTLFGFVKYFGSLQKAKKHLINNYIKSNENWIN